jgi:hypothetical protein
MPFLPTTSDRPGSSKFRMAFDSFLTRSDSIKRANGRGFCPLPAGEKRA